MEDDFLEEIGKSLLYLPSIMQKMNEIVSTKKDSIEFSYLYDCILYGGYQMIKRWVNEDCQIPPKEMALIIDGVFQKLIL